MTLSASDCAPGEVTNLQGSGMLRLYATACGASEIAVSVWIDDGYVEVERGASALRSDVEVTVWSVQRSHGCGTLGA